MSSHSNTHIHGVFEDIGSPPSYLLVMYIRYDIIINMNHTYNNTRVSLPRTNILGRGKT